MAINLNSLKKGKELKPPIIMAYGTPGIGKALENSMPVLMADGSWKPICEMKVGDMVATPDGASAPVLGVFPQGKRKVSKLETHDGAFVICDDDHLWLTETLNERRNTATCSGIFNRGRVRTTTQIAETLRTRTGEKNEAWNHYIPITKPVIGHNKDLPLDGYVVGVLLGDGSYAEGNSVALSCADVDIAERLKDVNFEWTSIQTKEGTHCLNFTFGGKRDVIRELGMYGKLSYEKSIPKDYLEANYETRLALFQGLMDTDGSWTASNGLAEFYSTSKKLAEDVVTLTNSLGCVSQLFEKRAFYTHNKERKEGRTCYRVMIHVPYDLVPFYAARKLARWKPREKYSVYRQIVSITPVGEAECTCIYIGHPQHLFITKDYLVTHNSTWASKAENAIFIQTEEGLNSLDVTKTPLVTSVEDFFQWLGVLATEEHNYKTLVIDTIDHFEQLVHKKVRKEHGDGIFSEFGKGYKFAIPEFQTLIDGLRYLRDTKNMTIIILGHAKIFSFSAPDQPQYDRYAPDLHESVASYLEENMDCLLFFNYKVYVTKEDKGFGKTEGKATGKGDRVCYTQERPPHRAKNRYNLEAEIPMSYDSFIRGVEADMLGQKEDVTLAKVTKKAKE